MQSLRRAQEHSLLLGRSGAAVKVATFLVDMADRVGCGQIIDLPMARQDIADYLALTIETVSRTLSRLERDAYKSLPTARRVCVMNERALRRIEFLSNETPSNGCAMFQADSPIIITEVSHCRAPRSKPRSEKNCEFANRRCIQ